MQVKIMIEVPLADLAEYMVSYLECNGIALTVEQAKKTYVEQFLADKNDYIDTDKITVFFV